MTPRKATPLTYSRGKKKRTPGKRIIIYCNGERTECGYFNDIKKTLRLPSADILVIGSGANRDSLIEEIHEDLRKQGIAPKKGYTEIYAVFDVDALPKCNNCMAPKEALQQVERALQLCKKYKDIPIVSNECFELWFLLHYQYCESAIHRDTIMQKLTKLVPGGYTKDKPMFHVLHERYPTAKKNAQKLHKLHSDAGSPPTDSPPTNNPSTNVHTLVDSLFALDRACPPPKKL